MEIAKRGRGGGFNAAKFGWGPIGRSAAKADADHFAVAHEGLGEDGILLVDVGQIFIEDVKRAAERPPALEAARAVWLEEPFAAAAYEAHGVLAKKSGKVKLAGGEGAHDTHMARHLIDHGGVGFVQIDCGRIGGTGPAKRVANHARQRGATYVNHTFTSHLALSASLQPDAGLADHRIAEYPAAPKPVVLAFVANPMQRDGNGEVRAPDAPGLGINIDEVGVKKYRLEVEIKVGGKVLYKTPRL
jgi:L-alanine-DL-glutamate epimerase-like enolase superfamily enzyme